MTSRAFSKGAIVAALSVVGLALPANAAVSTFDSDDEGWLITGDSTGVEPTYEPSGGNPGSYISADDAVQGGVWYFSAPSKFLGDQSATYGGTLSFDLRQSASDNQFDAEDIRLISGTSKLVYKQTSNPGTQWTSYDVPLVANAGWLWDENGNETAATETQMQNVLGDLDTLEIRGEYREFADVGDLDNVVLVPEPASLSISLALLASPMLCRGRRHRRA